MENSPAKTNKQPEKCSECGHLKGNHTTHTTECCDLPLPSIWVTKTDSYQALDVFDKDIADLPRKLNCHHHAVVGGK